jgi:hypothetical protein
VTAIVFPENWDALLTLEKKGSYFLAAHAPESFVA